MMTKQELLETIKAAAEQKSITRDELMTAYEQGSSLWADQASKKLDVTQILYYIGGGIVFLGIVILVGENWSDLSFITRMLVTFGAGLAAYVTGAIFSQYQKTEGVSIPFYLISGLIMPLGLGVVFDHAGFDVNLPATQTVIAALLFAMYGASYAAFRKNVFLLFTIIFATWFYYAAAAYLFNMTDRDKQLEYLTLAAGASYGLLGYSFAKTIRAPLASWLYAFGSIGFLGSAMMLGGFEPDQNIFWELIYPLLVFAVLYLSVYLKNRIFLIFGTIFLMGYILKITGEYFSTGLGWPLALVLAGLLMIAAGYTTIHLRRRYLTSETN